MMNSICAARSVGQPSVPDQHVLQQHRQQHHERRPGERAKDRPQPADDDHEQHQERLLDAERLAHLDRAQIDAEEQRPRDADKERRHREGRQLGGQRIHPDDLGGDVHVADRHPPAPHRPARQVPRQPGRAHHEDQAEQIGRPGLGARPGHRDPEHRAFRRADLARGGIVVEPRHPVEQPHQKELRRQRRHRQVKPLDPQATAGRTARRRRP